MIKNIFVLVSSLVLVQVGLLGQFDFAIHHAPVFHIPDHVMHHNNPEFPVHHPVVFNAREF